MKTSEMIDKSILQQKLFTPLEFIINVVNHDKSEKYVNTTKNYME